MRHVLVWANPVKSIRRERKNESMTFLWPWALILLLLVPLIVWAYIWMLRRKRRYAVRFSSIALIRAAMPRRTRWRRHLPFALFVAGLVWVMLAIARPAAAITVPLSRATIILAIDVSRSMCATDVAPNRLTVAQDAARAFIDDQADGTQIGIVAFTGLAEIVVPPTNDKDGLPRQSTTLQPPSARPSAAPFSNPSMRLPNTMTQLRPAASIYVPASRRRRASSMR